MFVELMANIKNEVLHNLFRSTSNLQAFENFLSTLPQFLLREHGPSAPTADGTRARAPRRPDDGRRRRFGQRRRRRIEARSRARAPGSAEGRAQRSVPLRQREEVQELLRPDGVELVGARFIESLGLTRSSQGAAVYKPPTVAREDGRFGKRPSLIARTCPRAFH